MKQKNTDIQEPSLKKPTRSKKQADLPKTPRAPQKTSKSRQAQEETKIIPVLESTIEKLKEVQKPVPEYTVPEENVSKKSMSFSRVIPNDSVIAALEFSSFKAPSDLLFSVLPATLRGSDTLIYKTEQEEGFLIGVIPAIFRILNAESEKAKNDSPSSVLLFSSIESAKAAYTLAQEIFKDLNIKFSENLEYKNVDVLFSTPTQLVQASNSDQILSNLKLLCIYELQSIDGNDKDSLKQCLTKASQAKAQKILVSYQNSPKVRELAFEFLEDPEVFVFIPSYVVEQSPRQFAHALEATKKFQVLLGYLKTFKPRAALVVANTKTVAEWIAFKLNGNNIKVSLLTSDIYPHQKRAEYLKSVNNGEINVVVTTDYTLKNFALENINCIYHFDLPDNPNAYMNRLNKIEGARNPISIAFVCEDYGYNIGKIEEKLGFKIKVTRPDKNFFNFKDVSEYPLESDGRVKKIGQTSEERVDAQVIVPVKQAEDPTLQVRGQKPQIPAQQSQVEQISATPRVASAVPIRTQNETKQAPEQKQTSRHHQPDTSKFVRRDERAREAVADALQAAKMAEERKRKSQIPGEFDKHTAQSSVESNQGLLSGLFFIVSEAVKAGVHATKESVMHNTERKFPKVYKFLNRSKHK